MAWLSLCLTFKISANFTYYLEMEDLSFAVFCSNITCGVCIYIPKANNIFLVFFLVEFRLVVFRPFIGEVIRGTVKNQSQAGVSGICIVV